MPFLTKEAILSARDLAIEQVPVPEWGEGAVVGVRVMRGYEYDYFDEQVAKADGGYIKNFRPLVCALTLCDEHGGRLFEVADIEALAEKSEVALDRVYEAACRLNRLRKQDQEALQKNFNGGPGDAPGSA